MSTIAYPRIWNRHGGERIIIGETRVSWLLKPDTDWMDPIKVKKKTPNPNADRPQWFFDEHTWRITVWADTHFHGIKNAIGDYSRRIDPETLHRVAEVIGYMPTLNSSQTSTISETGATKQ